MSYDVAIIDVAKDAGNPILNLPKAVNVSRRGKIWHLSHEAEQLFTRVVFENDTRWIAIAVGTVAALQWIRSRLDGAKVRRLTKELYLANEKQLTAIGLPREVVSGRAVLRLPHVICGQAAFIELEE